MKLEKNVLASYILQACKSNKCFTVSKPTTFCLSIGFHKMFLCHATLFVPPPKSRCVIFIQVSLPSKTYIKGMRIIPQAFVFSPPTSLRYITLYLMPWVQGLTYNLSISHHGYCLSLRNNFMKTSLILTIIG